MCLVERERKKAEKQAKFDQKKAASAAKTGTTGPSKTKEKKAALAAEKKPELPPYVEETKPGDKKSKAGPLPFSFGTDSDLQFSPQIL